MDGARAVTYSLRAAPNVVHLRKDSPAGAYIIKDGEVTWQPALDINRVILGGQLVAIVVALTIGSVIRARVRARADDE